MSEKLFKELVKAVREFHELTWGEIDSVFGECNDEGLADSLSDDEYVDDDQQKKALLLIKRATVAGKKALDLWRPIYLFIETGSFDDEDED